MHVLRSEGKIENLRDLIKGVTDEAVRSKLENELDALESESRRLEGLANEAEQAKIEAETRQTKLDITKPVSQPRDGSPQVFVSYASGDRWFAREVVNALESMAIRGFLDERSVDYGQPIDEGLVMGLKQSDSIVLIVSKESAHSDWVKYEIGAAWTLDKHMVPIRLDSVEPPIVTSRLKYVDATQNQLEAIRELKEHFARRYGTE